MIVFLHERKHLGVINSSHNFLLANGVTAVLVRGTAAHCSEWESSGWSEPAQRMLRADIPFSPSLALQPNSFFGLLHRDGHAQTRSCWPSHGSTIIV